MAIQPPRTDAHKAHSEELVFTESADGIPLEGALISPAGGRGPDAIAVVWIHGGASKFYERHYVAIGRRLAARGYPFLTGNTRGHDAFTLLWRGDEPIPAGGSFERFDDSPHDIAAWADFAAALQVRGIVLIGHSLGASKVVYYQAERQDPRVRGLVAASPPVGWQSFPERIALAERMVAEGHGEELLPHLEGTPRWNIVSAQMVLTREQVIRQAFESDTAVPSVARVECPLLLLYGAAEEVSAAWLETVRTNARSAARVDIELIDQAGHDYTGQESQVAERIAAWMEQVN